MVPRRPNHVSIVAERHNAFRQDFCNAAFMSVWLSMSMRRRPLYAIAALAVLGGCGMARANDSPRVGTPANLNALLRDAKGGEVIVLSSGDYPPIRLLGRTFAKPLVIDASAATLNGVYANRVEGLDIRGGEFHVPPPFLKAGTDRMIYGAALRLDDVKNVRLSDLKIVGPGALPGAPEDAFGEGDGIKIFVGSDVEVTNGRFTGLKNGLALSRIDGFRISGNAFEGMRADGMNISAVRNGVIQHNECRGTRVRDGEHPDCIQVYSRPEAPPTADLVIRNNTAEGPTQGVFLGNHTHNGINDGGFDRILIEDNDLYVGFANAIAVMDGRNSIVRNNRIRTFPGAPYQARITLRGDVIQCGNIVASAGNKTAKVDQKC